MSFYQFLTILLILSLPFIPEQFIAVSVKVLIGIFSIFLLPVFFKAFILDIKRKFLPTILFLAFLFVTGVTTIFSIDKEKSITQFLIFFCYFIIFVSIRSIFPTLRSKQLLVSCYLLIVTCLSIISLYNTLIRHYVSRDALSFMWIYFGHNHLSALLVFAIPLTLYFLKTYWAKKQIRFLLIVNCLLLIISLLLTFSIGSMLSLAASFLIVLILFRKTVFPKRSPLKKVYFVVFLIIAVFSISSFYIFSETKGIKIKYVSPQTKTTKKIRLYKDPVSFAEARFIYWNAAYSNFLKNPLTGTGLETFDKALAKFGNIGKAAYTTHAHNFFIQMLTDTGIFGFLTSIALIAAVLRQGYQNIKNASLNGESFFYLSLFVGILSSTLNSLVDLDWHAPTVFLFFWIFVGLLRKNVN